MSDDDLDTKTTLPRFNDLLARSSIGQAISRMSRQKERADRRGKVCECPVEHSVTKLGHILSCPFVGTVRVSYPKALAPGGGCPPRHADGTPHDFDWASYVGDNSTYGVCSCGLTAMDHDLMVMP